jgi:hypothetical protein
MPWRICLMSQTTRFADELCDAGYAILNEVVLNQALVSFDEPERMRVRAMIAAIQNDGTSWAAPLCGRGRPPCVSASHSGARRTRT